MGLNKKNRKDTKKVEVYLVVAVPIEGFTSMAAFHLMMFYITINLSFESHKLATNPLLLLLFSN